MANYDFDEGFSCEFCGKTLGGGLYNFDESVELLKQYKWISRRVKGEWLNFCCEECLHKYREKHN